MPNRVISLRDASVYFSKSGPLAEALRKGALKGVYSAALRAKRDLQTREMTSLGGRAPVDRGIFRAGWQVEKTPRGATIYNPVPHASFIEYGVPAANVVPSGKAQQALAEWARRKLGGLDEKKAWQVAGAILASLRKRGIFNRGQGLRILERYARDVLPAVLKEEVERELKKAVE